MWEGDVTQREEGADLLWFYEDGGQRKGPVPEREIQNLIASAGISHGTLVWKHGLATWTRVEDTALRVYLDSNGPPPLPSEHINNTVVWILAFAPILGYVIEWVVALVVNDGNEFAAQIDMANVRYWYVTLILNIGLSIFDERRLEKAGYNTEKFKGWVWLVPVYMYQRAKNTNQSFTYFIAWLICFALLMLM